MPECAGLAAHSIPAASETWPHTHLPNQHAAFPLTQVCSAAGTTGPSQPCPQQCGVSHLRAMATHPPTQATRSTDPGSILQRLLMLQSLPDHIFITLLLREAGAEHPELCSETFRWQLPAGRAKPREQLPPRAQWQEAGASPPAPSNLLDEVEVPVQRGVHLPASGQPYKDRAEAGVTLPHPTHLSFPPRLCPAVGWGFGWEQSAGLRDLLPDHQQRSVSHRGPASPGGNRGEDSPCRRQQ